MGTINEETEKWTAIPPQEEGIYQWKMRITNKAEHQRRIFRDDRGKLKMEDTFGRPKPMIGVWKRSAMAL